MLFGDKTPGGAKTVRWQRLMLRVARLSQVLQQYSPVALAEQAVDADCR